MKIVDISTPIYEGMPVFPCDPEVSVRQIQTVENDGWDMRRICMSTHDGTHVNTQMHSNIGGNNLDQYSLDQFCGPCRTFRDEDSIESEYGIIFSEEITMIHTQKILDRRPRFVGATQEIDLDVERVLLKEDIILFERLTNTQELPDEFMFYGFPLKISGADGSPVRAIAIVQ